MTEFSIAQWQSELLRIVTDNAKNLDSGDPGQSVDFVLDAITSAETAGNFTDLPANFDIRIYAQQVLATNSNEGAHDPDRIVNLGDSYTFVLEYISEKGPDGLAIRNSNGGFDAPLSGVDDFTYLFLLGAWATNTSSSIGNDFGLIARVYNDTQYEIRFGQEPSSLTQQASDAIAFAIARDVEDNGGLRTLFDLGQEDGSQSDRVLWDGHGSRPIGSVVRGVDFGGWAGTPFVTVLRAEQFFQRDILYYTDSGQVDSLGNPIFEEDISNPNAAGYDLLALTQSLASAVGTQANTLSGAVDVLIDALDQLDGAQDGTLERIGTGSESATLGLTELEKADDFLAQAYGENFSFIGTATSLLLFGPVGGPAFSSVVPQTLAELVTKAAKVPGQGVIAIGTNNSAGDLIGKNSANSFAQTTDFNDIVHGGLGDDTIIADGGSDVIDGGAGVDTVDYSEINTRLDFRIFDLKDLDSEQRGAIAESFVGTVSRGDFFGSVPFSPEDMLYGVENIIGTDYDDKFYVNRLRNDLTIDGGEGEDFLSFADRDAGITLSIAGDATGVTAVDPETFSYLNIVNIEGIEGTSFDDYILLTSHPLSGGQNGDNTINHIIAGDGFDTVDLSNYDAGVVVSREYQSFLSGILGAAPHFDVFVQNGGQTLEIYNAERLILTDHNDKFSAVLEEGIATVLEVGEGADEVYVTDRLGIADLGFDDRISVHGAQTLYGGVRSSTSESPYTPGLGGLVQYGLNAIGELVIKLPVVNNNPEMFVLNWLEDAVNQGSGGAQLGPGNITLGEVEVWTGRLLDDNKPNGLSIQGLWEAFGLLIKTMVGWDGYGGGDPLVLDLDGDGIELTTLNSISPFFDIDYDLYAEQAAFATGDDGVLARDINGDGVINDASELFGYGTTSGFSVLSTLDGNLDGVIDANDNGLADFNGDGTIDANDTFGSLLAWQDVDRDTEVDAGEKISALYIAANDNIPSCRLGIATAMEAAA